MGRFEFSWRLKLSYNKSQLHLIMLLRAIISINSFKKIFFSKIQSIFSQKELRGKQKLCLNRTLNVKALK